MHPKRVVLFACSLFALAIPAGGSAATRMWIGFQDDPSFRWRDDRAVVLDAAHDAGASILRTTVYWSKIAPTRPANAADPNDPAYLFDDLDEFVRGAELRGMEVMLTIWGTPPWANGGKGQNYAPTNFADLTNFAKAVATRYSGRFPGFPFVQFYTVWNESNLGQFLSPQYDKKGRPVGPAIYAKIYRAAYAGIKAGNPKALVGMGETSARGRDKLSPSPGTLQDTESPGRFAELLSEQRPKLKFDAWSQHPYPTSLTQKPNAIVRWPNVTLSQLPRFETSLNQWFGRTSTPIWITEYAYQTKPPEPGGVTYAQQAAYAKQALQIAEAAPYVQMFIWFILRDDPTSTWQSGLLQQDGIPKPALATFAPLAKVLDARNPIMNVAAGVTNPVVRVPVLELYSRNGAGAPVYMTARAYVRGKLVGVSQPTSAIGIDGFVAFPAPTHTIKGKGVTYTVTADMADAHGNRIFRTATLITT